MADFLFEIGLEEVPARMIAAAQAELLRRVTAMLGKEGLLAATFDAVADAKSYSTPRRLAVLVRGVLEGQADSSDEVVGPAVKIAFKDGKPGPAAEAFARKNGVAVGDLRTLQTPKGEYLAATSVKKGRSASEVIAQLLPAELAGIYWAKNMYWRPGKPERFVRPVLWMVCLLGDAVVPVEFGGRTAGRVSYGHRVLSSGEAFEVRTPESYLAQLEGEYVLADVEVRRQKIRKALDHATRRVEGARWREDEALVDGVTHLTEWPDVLLGGFEPEYLALPEEVLVTVMRDHQKYFAVESADGKLAPHFLAVLNIALNETNEPIIRQGNERVLRARFNDARFFWEFDQRVPLVERVEMLKNVTFQKELGSYWDKTQSVVRIVQELARSCVGRGGKLAEEAYDELVAAAQLCKVDLTTELVKEFTDLQGRIGGLYARAGALGDVVADCIYWQYEPRNAAEAIPSSTAAQLLTLADRMNTIVDMIALGHLPTGSKDPFALRRNANGVVKVLAEGSTRLRLTDVHVASARQSKLSSVNSTTEECWKFLDERVTFYLREVRGFDVSVVRAVMKPGADDVADAVARAKAVAGMQTSDDFVAVSAAFKRMKNIVEQAYLKNEPIPEDIDSDLYREECERQLAVATGVASLEVGELSRQAKYEDALKRIAQLRPAIDEFFEKVMVMDPDARIRANRLALLQRTLSHFSRIADFSEIAVAG